VLVPSVFLIGGGGDYEGRAETYGRFLQAATTNGRCSLALVVAADDPGEAQATYNATLAIFAALGAGTGEIAGIYLSSNIKLTADHLATADPTGVFVCGGLTPLYQRVLCVDRSWLDYVEAREITFGGVSAGAAIAATNAIVGGWQAQRGGHVRSILYQGAGEGLDLLDVRPGLGLVPFTVEIHASQWGTLTRLLHAIDLGLVTDGWAIDEDTLLQVDTTGLQVHGSGQVYHVRRPHQGPAQVSIYSPPDWIPW
jgi:cyanophycinase